MNPAMSTAPQNPSYALNLANGSYEWYKAAAIRSRRGHRISAVTVQALAAAIPAAAAITPKNAVVPAVLGAVIVVVSSLRSIFRWQENYLRFSGAREAVEAERRLYHTESSPYDDPGTRDQILTAKVTKIEQEEMAGWIKISAEQTRK